MGEEDDSALSTIIALDPDTFQLVGDFAPEPHAKVVEFRSFTVKISETGTETRVDSKSSRVESKTSGNVPALSSNMAMTSQSAMKPQSVIASAKRAVTRSLE